MVRVQSRYAHSHFGEVIDTAQREPVSISRNGRDIAVVISQHEYERLLEAEDALLAKHADEAYRNAKWLGPEASEKALKDILDAQA